MGKVFNMVVDESGIGVITFDVVGEAMNTWTEDAFIGFDRVMQELEIAKGIRGIIFISGKPENFLAGANLKLISQIESAKEVRRTLDLFHGSFARLIALKFPSVAAIHGYCLGGGLEIALACDFRIATRDAQLGFPEVNLGLLPGGGGTQRAPRLTSPGRARWLIMSGERIPAETAQEWGLVEFVVDDLEEGIARYVEPLDKQSPHAIAQIKQLLRETRDERSDEREVKAFADCLNSEDGQEGVAAFLEKRAANWTGR